MKSRKKREEMTEENVFLDVKGDFINTDKSKHLVDVMFPYHTKSFFNMFMKEAFPKEFTPSYIQQWYDRFLNLPSKHNTSPSVNFFFLHDGDTHGENGTSTVFYPMCRMDFERTDTFLRMMKERIDTLIKEHKEVWDSYKKPEKD